MVSKGTVSIFNAVKGVGFVRGEDGERRFFHQSDLKVSGFRAIVVGKEVQFVASSNGDRPAAKDVQPVNGIGIQVADPLPKAISVDKLNEGNVVLILDSLDRIYANEDLFPFGQFVISPSLWGTDGSFRAFRAGGVVKKFTLHLPKPNPERVFLALDPDKRLLPMKGKEVQLPLGSYVLALEANGKLDVQCVGRRYQSEKGGGNWVVLEHRLRHMLDLAASLDGQLPTSDLARDNDGFIPALKEAASLLSK